VRYLGTDVRYDQRHLGLDRLLNTRRRNRGAMDMSVGLMDAIGRGPYGTKMADAVAPVCLIASSTVAKTGLPRCSLPAFFGFVPPMTFVPVVPRQWRAPVLSEQVAVAAHTILDRLLGVEPANPSARRVRFLHQCHSRSLLSREALEQHFGVAVDAEVLDGF